MNGPGVTFSIVAFGAVAVAGCGHMEPSVPTPAAPRATPPVEKRPAYDLTGRWRGTYSYPSVHEGRAVANTSPVEFVIDIVADGLTLGGKVTEPNTFGDATSDRLYADIEGEFFEDNKVVFEKTYDGTGGVSHTVRYEGYLDPEADEISGEWRIRHGWSGPFEIEKQAESEGEIAFPPHERKVQSEIILIPVY
jgi:hypothetical protein